MKWNTRTLFSHNLAELLEQAHRRGVLQLDLAKSVGVSEVKLSQLKAGERFPRPERIDRLAKALKVPIARFFRVPKG